MRDKETQAKTTLLIVLALPIFVRKESSANNCRYSGFSISRRFIENGEMGEEMGVSNIPQDSFVILRKVQHVTQRLLLP